jgi:hypothetical protein
MSGTVQLAFAQIYRIHSEIARLVLTEDMGSERGVYTVARQQGRAEGLLQCIDYLIALAEEDEDG